MPISRMQQPRQLYGLGSFVKSVGKAVKGAVKGVTSTVKENPALALAALNFAPMLAGAKPFIGMGSLTGSKYTLPGISSLFSTKAGESTLGKTLGVFAAGSLLPSVLGEAEETGDVENITRNVPALKTKLTQAYKLQRTFADSENEDAAIAEQVEKDVSEYTAGQGAYAVGGRVGYSDGTPSFEEYMRERKVIEQNMNQERLYKEYLEDMRRKKVAQQKQMAAEGGRIGYAKGTDNPFTNLVNKISSVFVDEKGDYRSGLQKAKFALSKFIAGKGYDYRTGAEWYNKLDEDTQREILEMKQKIRDNPERYGFSNIMRELAKQPVYDEEFAGKFGIGSRYAEGGRIGYARGTDDIVDQASGIMGLPQRINKAGVKELDLRESGGFIPPVGVKEKADDIPAMLSNNEFVFTADAVRGMGGGDVNKGAQRLYDQMKMLEKGGRV